MSDTKELQVQENTTATELTKTGPVFTPDVDIYETDTEIVLMADMPGVTPDALTIDLRDSVLTLSGGAAEAEKGKVSEVFSEFQTGQYYRRFTLSEIIDQANINAQLIDGVLHLALPKVAKATPRKITVTTG
jgi:HSP20 family molecular chaperone IbpA